MSASALVLTACSGEGSDAAGDGDFDGRTLVYTSYGGTTEQYTIESWGEPFIENTGADVHWASPVDLGKIRAMVESGNVEWDLVQASYQIATAPGYEDLYEEIDTDEFDQAGLVENAVTEYGTGTYLLTYLIAYRTDNDRTENPSNWEEFYDTERFPGKRGIESISGALVLETALLADGVEPEDLYPLDLDRAFAKLDTIKDDIVWHETGAQQQEMLQNGTVDYLMAWNGRAFDLIQKGVPVELAFGQQVAYQSYHVIPKGSENTDMAIEFMKQSLEPEQQAAMAERTGYSPVNNDALDLVPSEVAQYLPTYGSNADSLVWISEDYWTENLDMVSERWNSWLLE